MTVEANRSVEEYRAQIDHLLRRRALMVSILTGAVVLAVLLVFVATLFRSLHSLLTQHIQDDAVSTLQMAANGVPSSLLTQPLYEDEALLRETDAYLEKTLLATHADQLFLARLPADGNCNIILGVSHTSGDGVEHYEGLPCEIPFDPATVGKEDIWIGGLRASGRIRVGHQYLAAYKLFFEGGRPVGFLGVYYPLYVLDTIVARMWVVVLVMVLLSIFLAIALSRWVTQKTLLPLHAFFLPVENVLVGDLSRRYQPPAGLNVETALIDMANEAAQILEGRVSTVEEELERTRQATERRASYLAATAQIGRIASTILDVDTLLDESARMVARYFGFYHVGLFLIDESQTWVVLRAASSEGGKRMLARKHRLRIGQGVVGYAAQTGRPRVASDVDVDVVWVSNPDLPETRSEMAVPMNARGHIVGVLDVQSKEPAAFSAEDVATLRVLANQLAVAIDNARLYRASQAALEEARALRTQETGEAWRRWRSRLYGYRFDSITVQPIREPLTGEHAPSSAEVSTEANTLSVPLVWGGFAIGRLRIHREPSRPWTASEVRLVEAAVADIAQALENARLLEEIRERAYVEQTVGRVRKQLQSLVEPETILKEAVRYLGKHLDIDYAMIEVVPESEEPAPPSAQEGAGEGGGQR